MFPVTQTTHAIPTTVTLTIHTINVIPTDSKRPIFNTLG